MMLQVGMKQWMGMMALVVALMVSVPAQAGGNPEVPAAVDGVTIVDSEQVMAAMESGSAFLLDCRKASGFSGGTVPGSVNCQVATGDATLDDADVAATMEKLKAECAGLMDQPKDKAIITFCNGLTCWRSPKAALALTKLGFSNVQWYRLGMNDWKAQSLPIE
ncbi:Rhodanese domain protein [Magnetococcus marinus MC-1]|uniref:Rhodanese domain protein n=1 Tax=Magnetococcus marinus (strain ATCC BAA-1437 / JCM 17883 / MC-1) TaxID=156889 RepID=A0L7U0_MAGMM|nr:rhodanese-like domain-containing protein [Magnetococcus marinus]ABK44033.1 Rhodanese domain protein [Magnetococcus marinus MC-1]